MTERVTPPGSMGSGIATGPPPPAALACRQKNYLALSCPTRRGFQTPRPPGQVDCGKSCYPFQILYDDSGGSRALLTEAAGRNKPHGDSNRGKNRGPSHDGIVVAVARSRSHCLAAQSRFPAGFAFYPPPPRAGWTRFGRHHQRRLRACPTVALLGAAALPTLLEGTDPVVLFADTKKTAVPTTRGGWQEPLPSPGSSLARVMPVACEALRTGPHHAHTQPRPPFPRSARRPVGGLRRIGSVSIRLRRYNPADHYRKCKRSRRRHSERSLDE